MLVISLNLACWRADFVGLANSFQFGANDLVRPTNVCMLIVASLILFGNSKTTCDLLPKTTSISLESSTTSPIQNQSHANLTSPFKLVALDSTADNYQAYVGSESFQEEPTNSDNNLESEPSLRILIDNNQYEHVACGTISANKTKLLVRNPNYPEPIYSKTICETVIKRAEPSITRLTIRFKLFQLYRPTLNGQCLHDRFAVFTDLNALLTPVICGDNTGKTLTVPFPLQSSVIISITTSDLDHDRFWWIEIEQEK